MQSKRRQSRGRQNRGSAQNPMALSLQPTEKRAEDLRGGGCRERRGGREHMEERRGGREHMEERRGGREHMEER